MANRPVANGCLPQNSMTDTTEFLARARLRRAFSVAMAPFLTNRATFDSVEADCALYSASGVNAAIFAACLFLGKFLRAER
ncbi:hypothetical protein B9P52_22360 [Achromobacter denitrificans]|nr:hypothetical protein B9P52_22360 [Achromobacter denitrificans]